MTELTAPVDGEPSWRPSACWTAALSLAGLRAGARVPRRRCGPAYRSAQRPGVGPVTPARRAAEPVATGATRDPPSVRRPRRSATRPGGISVALAGDVLVQTGVWETAERDAARRGERLPDFRPMFAGVKDQIASADLAICHMETPLSRPARAVPELPGLLRAADRAGRPDRHRVRRVHDRVQPLRRPGVHRTGPHDRRVRPPRPRPHRHVRHAARRPPATGLRRARGAGRR